jgi:hypothetical protein
VKFSLGKLTQGFSLRRFKTRDIVLCVIAALLGAIVAEIPTSTAWRGPDVHPWIRAYIHLGNVMWEFPWSLLVLCILLALLFKAKFRGGVWGLHSVLEAALSKQSSMPGGKPCADYSYES